MRKSLKGCQMREKSIKINGFNWLNSEILKEAKEFKKMALIVWNLNKDHELVGSLAYAKKMYIDLVVLLCCLYLNHVCMFKEWSWN